MKRRTFINKMGKGSALAAVAAAGINSAHADEIKHQGSDLYSGNGQAPGAPRLPEDLEKLAGGKDALRKPDDLTVACYVFPNYHASAIHNKLYGPGWTEYNLVRSARPWFEGHQQPRGPLLGELDERQPGTWEKYNQLAKQHGIDAFIWDWYWYNGEPALHEALEDGFLRASNTNDVKFACMWTNHPWYILYPTQQVNGKVNYPPSYQPPDTDLNECWRSLSYMISRYFHQSNYWKIAITGKLMENPFCVSGILTGWRRI